MDIETMKILAEAAARAAAEKIAEEVKQDLHKELAGYFGELKPSQHAIQHDRLERLLKLADYMGTNFLTKILMQTFLWGSLVTGGAYFLWQKLTGH